MSEDNLKYFGKYHSFSDSVSKKIWIGPMTQAEMEQEFPEYRHNIRNTRQSPESKKIDEALEYINSGIARSQNELTVKRLCKLKSILEAK